jgi:hypothetical protein
MLTSASRLRTNQGRGGTRRRHVAGSHWPQAAPRRTACDRLGRRLATQQHTVRAHMKPHGRAGFLPGGRRGAQPLAAGRPCAYAGFARRATWRAAIGRPKVGWPVGPVRPRVFPFLQRFSAQPHDSARFTRLESGFRPVLCSTDLGRRAPHCSRANRPWEGRFGPRKRESSPREEVLHSPKFPPAKLVWRARRFFSSFLFSFLVSSFNNFSYI